MTLEEIKDAIVGELEKLWHELDGTADLDKARAVIADSGQALNGHVSAVGQHLFDHVLANAQAAGGTVLNPGEAGVASSPTVPGQEAAAEIDPSGEAATGVAGPAETPGGTQLSDGGHVAGDSNPDAPAAG